MLSPLWTPLWAQLLPVSPDTSIEVLPCQCSNSDIPVCLKLGLSSTQFKGNQLVRALHVP